MEWNPNKPDITKINKGKQFGEKDGVRAGDINEVVNASLWAANTAANVEQRANDGEFTVFNSPTASKFEVRDDGNLWLICTDEIASNYNK